MYIFLDIDGVLNQLHGNYYLDEKCVITLAKICHKIENPRIVLTSTWRPGFCHDYVRCTPQIQKLRDLFQKNDIEIYSRTGKNCAYRDEEILAYLSENASDSYIILDDDRSLFKNTDHLYVTNGRTGLTEKDMKAILRMI